MSSQNVFGHPFIELHSVDSTNNYAMQLVHAGMAQHGTVVFAHEQTKGKGQRQKHWVSNAHENIMMSLVFVPHALAIGEQFLLSMAVANGVHRFFDFYTNGNTKIKWPNDIYWCDRKAGGILIENVIQGREWKFAIIGIGLNINQTSFNGFKNKPVSLKQITGKNYNTVVLAKELLRYLEKAFQTLSDQEKVVTDYHEHLYKLHQQVTLKKENKIFHAVIKRVTPKGQLVVHNFMEDAFSVGEVEWIAER